jgi:transcriptional regulator with XRE-family HTH domain
MSDEPRLRKLLGARIRSEANDLKRTEDALANELSISRQHVDNILSGEASLSEIHCMIEKMAAAYPVDAADMRLCEDDCDRGIGLMRAAVAASSGRVFTRRDRNGEQAPYYEYRDTACSRNGPFRPEWIKQLRVVGDDDPENPDVAYNHGHALHQMTFFIGPVNFYWEVAGTRHACRMQTGDSNYITPFWPHSFATRESDKPALILAVTFGGEVRRALRDCYTLRPTALERYYLPSNNPGKARVLLLRQRMQDEGVTESVFMERLGTDAEACDLTRMLDEKHELTVQEQEVLARALHVEVGDLAVPTYRQEEEVVIRHRDDNHSYLYPDRMHPAYRVLPLARCRKMPAMKGLDLEVLGRDASLGALECSLHTYVYNYGKSSVALEWEFEGETHREVLHTEDSVYLRPFVRHGFENTTDQHGQLCVMRAGGGVSIAVQREMSAFAGIDRLIESKRWF